MSISCAVRMRRRLFTTSLANDPYAYEAHRRCARRSCEFSINGILDQQRLGETLANGLLFECHALRDDIEHAYPHLAYVQCDQVPKSMLPSLTIMAGRRADIVRMIPDFELGTYPLRAYPSSITEISSNDHDAMLS
jgi:hypothetical protein